MLEHSTAPGWRNARRGNPAVSIHVLSQLILLVGVAAGPTGAQEAGSQGPDEGVICIDEGHNNRFTLDGRFAMAAEIWRRDGFVLRSSTAAFSTGALRACNILVIANALHERNIDDWSLPTPSAFTPEEIDAVRAWVEAGGALLLLADHMPMPGAAADLASALGVRFTNGFAMDTAVKSGTIVFRRSDGNLRSHPITEGRSASERVDSVVTYTGQAFLSDGRFVELLVIPAGIVSFLPQVAWQFPEGTPTLPAGGWLQGAAASFGRGRLVVFGEAAQFRPAEDGVSPRAQNGRLIRNVMLWLANRM